MTVLYKAPLDPTGPLMTYYSAWRFDSFYEKYVELCKWASPETKVRTELLNGAYETPISKLELDSFVIALIQNKCFVDDEHVYTLVHSPSPALIKHVKDRRHYSIVDLQVLKPVYQFKVSVLQNNTSLMFGPNVRCCGSWYLPNMTKHVEVPSVLNHCIQSFLKEAVDNKRVVNKTFKDDNLTIKVETKELLTWCCP